MRAAALLDSLLHRTWPAAARDPAAGGTGPPGRSSSADGKQILTFAEDRSCGSGACGVDPREAPVRTLGAPAVLARVDVSGRTRSRSRPRVVEVWETATGRTLRKIAPATTEGRRGWRWWTVPGPRRSTARRRASRRRLEEAYPALERQLVRSHARMDERREISDFAGVLQFNEDGSRLLTWSASQSGLRPRAHLDVHRPGAGHLFGHRRLLGARFRPERRYS